MKKKLLNFKNAKVLGKSQQKEIAGGNAMAGCGCAGRPSGSKCYYGCHKGCPGSCNSGGSCNPW